VPIRTLGMSIAAVGALAATVGRRDVTVRLPPWGGERVSAMSRIEWTDTTWNPTTGCDRVSAGCDNCYALTLAKRLKATPRAFGKVVGVGLEQVRGR
jgi:hypothetical protein